MSRYNDPFEQYMSEIQARIHRSLDELVELSSAQTSEMDQKASSGVDLYETASEISAITEGAVASAKETKPDKESETPNTISGIIGGFVSLISRPYTAAASLAKNIWGMMPDEVKIEIGEGKSSTASSRTKTTSRYRRKKAA